MNPRLLGPWEELFPGRPGLGECRTSAIDGRMAILLCRANAMIFHPESPGRAASAAAPTREAADAAAVKAGWVLPEESTE